MKMFYRYPRNFAMMGLFVLLIIMTNMVNAAELKNPVGVWKTIDDKTQQPRSVVEITERKGKLFGEIRQIFPQPGEEINPLCDKCSGTRYNQPKIGMVILWDFISNPQQAQQWINGEILDPHSGKIYRCQMTLLENGDKLEVRGYIGLPLLGRTQVWQRVE